MTVAQLSDPRRRARLAPLLPYLLLALCMLCWAGNWVIGRAVRDALPPVALTFWRWAVTAVLLAPFALPRLRGKLPVLRRDWRVIFGLGLAGSAFFQAIVYTGLRYTEVINATLMNSASPLFIILIAWLVDGERATRRQIGGMLISFCGILVILDRGGLGQIRDFHFNPGDLLILLLGMPAWGIYSVLLKRRPPELDGIGLLFAITIACIIVLAPFYVAESLFLRAPQWSWPAAGAVFYTAAFASGIAYICWNRGVAMVGPNRAGFTIHLLPAFTTILAMLTLGEEPHLYHLIGIATILLGVWLASSARAPLQVAAGK